MHSDEEPVRRVRERKPSPVRGKADTKSRASRALEQCSRLAAHGDEDEHAEDDARKLKD